MFARDGGCDVPFFNAELEIMESLGHARKGEEKGLTGV